MTEVLQVDPTDPKRESIARAAECLRGGGLVAFPTETVYGLGAHALDRRALQRVFAAKERPAHDPLIVHVAVIDDIEPLVIDIPRIVPELAARFWPGPLTLVLRRSERVPDEVTAGLDTVAIRVPSHPIAQALLRSAQLAIAAPSANRFSRPSPTRAAHVLADLADRIDMILDGGPTTVGLESTVVDLTQQPPMVLRPGAIDADALRAVIPEVAFRSGPAAAGTVGYHVIAGFSWVDSFLNASMLLGGMGPVGDLPNDSAKLFASVFALYSGLLFLVAAGLMLAPVFHRVLHRFHWEDQ